VFRTAIDEVGILEKAAQVALILQLMQGAVLRANADDLLGHSRDAGVTDEVGLVLVGEVLESEVFGLGKEEGREKARKHDWG
jgi:hypothetical protein